MPSRSAPAPTPVLIDDIVSTARTMIETVARLRAAGCARPVCVGVHAVFSQRAYDDLIDAGAARVVTCNTIPHRSNAIDVIDLLGDAMARFPRSPREGRKGRLAVATGAAPWVNMTPPDAVPLGCAAQLGEG